MYKITAEHRKKASIETNSKEKVQFRMSVVSFLPCDANKMTEKL